MLQPDAATQQMSVTHSNPMCSTTSMSNTNAAFIAEIWMGHPKLTSGSAMAEGPRDALVSRNSATTKYPYRMALFA